jgi:CubicO group peptidase (beta-lactamase class C family)
MTDLHEQIGKLVDASPVSGVAMAVINKSDIDIRCYGTHQGQSLDGETRLLVASLTKPVFAYGVMQLVERELIELDRPLVDYLPYKYLEDEPYLSQMTARHALSHSTGFPNWRDPKGLFSAFQPGTAFNYSSEGLNYLQVAVEFLTDQPLSQYLENNVFVPLQMVNSRLTQEDTNRLQKSPHLAHLASTPLQSNGALSLETTIKDYSLFMQDMLRTENGTSFHLSPETLDSMVKPVIQVGEYKSLSWGLGWGIQHTAGEDNKFWHWGVRNDVPTQNYVVGSRTDAQALIVLTNDLDGFELCHSVAKLVAHQQSSVPAFDWLLPPEHWRADGSIPN